MKSQQIRKFRLIINKLVAEYSQVFTHNAPLSGTDYGQV